MNLLHQVHWIQQVRFNRSRSRAANIDAGDGSRLRKDHGTTGQPLRTRDLSNLDPWNIRQTGSGA